MRERARTKKLTRQTTKLVKKLLGSQNGKINCAHVFLFFLNCICSYVLLLLLFLFCFFMFSPLVICVFAASFNCCLLYTSLSLFHVSDFIAICNFRRDALLLLLWFYVVYFLVVVAAAFYIFCHCVMHAARQQLLCIILHILLGAFFNFWIFCIFHWPTKRDVATRSELNEPYTTIKIL